METGFQIDPDQSVTNVPYRKLVGRLLYLSTTSRPGSTFSVSYISGVLDKPTNQTWKAAKKVLWYLKKTKTTGLVHQKGEDSIESSTNADWACDKMHRKRISGAIIFNCGNPVR
ncbi:hypothetical protein ILUMI_10965 [Ignelater luminosus]|uniref:Uncharacterized protein n=1 Tax=Ignelater luminosus TaxID=2038154 RepID=A0A8K0CWX6_IGNLU|nr:hypothetical protein ILUMI_10965 [Ignelater luminosus]